MIKKAQSAVEYLVLIGLTLGIILPTTYLFFRYSSQSNEQIIDSQLNQVGNSIMDTAEIVYYSGKDSKIILELKVPFIVAINKIDHPSADPQKVSQQLAEYQVYLEGYGGDVPNVAISAKTGEGIPELLDIILLISVNAFSVSDISVTFFISLITNPLIVY